jgi:hypothetical protein
MAIKRWLKAAAIVVAIMGAWVALNIVTFDVVHPFLGR